MQTSHPVEFNLSNRPGERQALVRALEAFAETHQLPKTAVQAADLALEEHLTNVLEYGFDPGQTPYIRITFAVLSGFFVLEVSDNGHPFNPLSKSETDTTLPLDQKPVGGLGIHLIRKFMDELNYRRDKDRNVFTMRKRLSPEP